MARPRGAQPQWRPTSPRQKAILEDVLDMFAQHQRDGTLAGGRPSRGIFYDLRPNGFGRGVRYFKRAVGQKLGPMDADPETVQEVMLLMRRALILREDWVTDERAPDPLGPWQVSVAADAISRIEQLVERVRLNRQDGQDWFIEIWCESAGLGPRLAVVSDPYGVLVYPAGGFDGLKPKRQAAERVAQRAMPTLALHIGDYDKHGRWIFGAKAEDVATWVPYYEGTPGPWKYTWDRRNSRGHFERLTLDRNGTTRLIVERFAVTGAQVEDGTLQLDEEDKAEAEAMPAAWTILRDELEGRMDPARREAVIAREPELRRELRDVLSARWENNGGEPPNEQT